MNIRSNLLGFEICQKFIAAYQKQPNSLTPQQIHQFITNSDRNSLRMKPSFQPLQNVVKNLTPRLIQDASITQNIQTLSSTMSIYNFLNVYDYTWMQFSLDKIIAHINDHKKKNIRINLQNLVKIYRSIVELNYDQDQNSVAVIRKQFRGRFKSILEKSKISHWFYFNLQKIHGVIKYAILDPKRDIQLIQDSLIEINTIYQETTSANSFSENKTFPYSHSASIYELCLVFNIKMPQEGVYLDFLKRSYKNNLTAKNSQSSKSKQFQNKGQSVFEIRFQKHLIQNGYWFDRNIKVGIHQYDILLKGTQREQYYPFKPLNIQNFQYIHPFTPISVAQIKGFQVNHHIWYKQQLKSYQQDKILVNLNGPYHFLYGDKQGLTRSQEIKKDVALYYGYRRFKSVDYKEWQRQTPNKLKVKEYIDNIIKQS